MHIDSGSNSTQTSLFSTVGDHTFVVPKGVYRLKVTLSGGGGGGGGVMVPSPQSGRAIGFPGGNSYFGDRISAKGGKGGRPVDLSGTLANGSSLTATYPTGAGPVTIVGGSHYPLNISDTVFPTPDTPMFVGYETSDTSNLPYALRFPTPAGTASSVGVAVSADLLSATTQNRIDSDGNFYIQTYGLAGMFSSAPVGERLTYSRDNQYDWLRQFNTHTTNPAWALGDGGVSYAYNYVSRTSATPAKFGSGGACGLIATPALTQLVDIGNGGTQTLFTFRQFFGAAQPGFLGEVMGAEDLFVTPGDVYIISIGNGGSPGGTLDQSSSGQEAGPYVLGAYANNARIGDFYVGNSSHHMKFSAGGGRGGDGFCLIEYRV